MAGFENYAQDTRAIELEIERKGILLGIDWNDEAQLRALAREALDHVHDEVRKVAHDPSDAKLKIKVDLFGLAGLMLKTMTESAVEGIESHGGSAWKAFSRALRSEMAAAEAARSGDADAK